MILSFFMYVCCGWFRFRRAVLLYVLYDIIRFFFFISRFRPLCTLYYFVLFHLFLSFICLVSGRFAWSGGSGGRRGSEVGGDRPLAGLRGGPKRGPRGVAKEQGVGEQQPQRRHHGTHGGGRGGPRRGGEDASRRRYLIFS